MPSACNKQSHDQFGPAIRAEVAHGGPSQALRREVHVTRGRISPRMEVAVIRIESGMVSSRNFVF
jgi:hypothetical protein